MTAKGQPAEPSQKQSTYTCGYVRKIDNPGVVRALVERLASYGVPVDRITVEDDSLRYVRSLGVGSRVVVNSLFDLSSDISEIMNILSEAFAQDKSIVSLGDDNVVLDTRSTTSKELLTLLGKYASMSGPSSPRLVVSSGERRGHPVNAISPRRLETYMNAVRLYNDGHSMTSAAKEAGCSYSSFRYWYINNYSQTAQ